MGYLIGAGILAVCLLAAWLILRRPLRQIVEDVHVDHARLLFRQHREWLEARFITVLCESDPALGERWDSAHWHDDVLWARDRQTRRLLALVCVHFDPGPFEFHHANRHATAVFEFHNGQWWVEGKRFDEVRPDEAVGKGQRYEAVVLSEPHPRRVG
jgi:hypothetical protein